MIGDIETVMWKECKELLGLRACNRLRSGPWNLLILLLVFGVFMPLQWGRGWVESPLGLVYWAWVPLFLVSSIIADAFAGERERHTLETLLASRLPDLAILIGKAATAVLYAWSLTLASLLLGLVTVNLTDWSGHVLLYAPQVAAGGTVLGLLTAGLAAGAGVLVSLRAVTVRQAAQTMSIAVMLLVFVPVFGIQALPAAIRAALVSGLQHVDPAIAAGSAFLLIGTLDVGLIAAARARFRRSHLMLAN